MLAWTTAALTFTLMGITAFYAWSNYRVMRIMEADVRARTQPIPKLGINLAHNPHPGSRCYMYVTIRTENAPMKLKELGVVVFYENGKSSTADCLVGDPRLISPMTAAEFTPSYDSCGTKTEWHAVIIYTDLREAVDYVTKVSEHGYSLTMADSRHGLFRKLLDKAKRQFEEMDQA